VAFQVNHALAVANLEWHHKDPFDRGLIAQVQMDQMFLLTHDKVLATYGTSVLIT
jgi:PIN domain nuclease of toxin-antitoxin system